MKIVMISEDYLPNPGGIATHVFEISNALSELGHKVTIIGGHLREFDVEEKVNFYEKINDNFEVYNFKLNNTINSRIEYCIRTSNLIKKLNMEENIDILHWHCLFYDPLIVKSLKRILKAKYVFTNHTSGFLRRLNSPFWRKIMSILLKTADHIITPSTELMEKTRLLGDFNVSMISNGVNTKKFKRLSYNDEVRKKLGFSNEDRVAICTRRLVYKNGVDIAIKSWVKVISEIPNAKLLICGDGPERHKLESLIRELGMVNNIKLIGNVSRKDIISYYNSSDCALMPSRMEAISISALEAMAVGLPVIAMRVGGLPEIVIDGYNGFLVQPESHLDLACKIIKYFNCKDLSLSNNAREFVVNNYSWKIKAKETVKVYEQLTTRG